MRLLYLALVMLWSVPAHAIEETRKAEFHTSTIANGAGRTVPVLHYGTLYYYNNSHVGFWQSYVKMWNRRDGEAQGNWGLCNGAQAWDGNAGPGGRLCLDQVGTGAASGTTPATVQPQAALATRIWSNTGSVTGGCADTAQHSNKICNSNPTTIIDGTDYIFSDDETAAPGGYTAYTYPHPLVSGAEGGGSVTIGGMDLF